MKLNHLSRIPMRLAALILSLWALSASAAIVTIGNWMEDPFIMTFETSGTNATLTRISKGTGDTSVFEIPETITASGISYTVTAVTGLGSEASRLLEIIIPPTVTNIRGFEACLLLETLTIKPGTSALAIGLAVPASGTSHAVGQFKKCNLTTVNVGRSLEYGYEKDYGDLYDPYVDKAKFDYTPFRNLTNFNITGSDIRIPAQMIPEVENLNISGQNVVIWALEHDEDIMGERIDAGNIYAEEPFTTTGNVYGYVKNVYYKDFATLLACKYNNYLWIRDIKMYVGGELLDKVTIPDGTIEIPDYAFYYTGITGLTLPASVKSIGKHAFYNTQLVSLNLNSTETIAEEAFANCDRLTTVDLGQNITDIGDAAFTDCPLTTINFPATLRSIGSSAFSGTTLTRAEFAPGCVLESVGERAFVSTALTTVRFPDGLRTLGARAFENCVKLTYAELGKNLEQIEDNTFKGCLALSEIDIPASVKNIGESAFDSCTGLVIVTLNEGLGSIDKYAFRSTAMSQLTIPASVTQIKHTAFDNTDKLMFLTFSDSDTPLTMISSNLYAFYKTMFASSPLRMLYLGRDITDSLEHGLFQDQTALKSITFGSGITTLNNNIFKGCTAIEKIATPSNVAHLGSAAFSGCSALGSATLSEGLNDIGSYCFEGCALTELSIPASTKTVKSYAFRDCGSLTAVKLADSPAPVDMEGGSTHNSNLFGDCPLATLHIGRDVTYDEDTASPFRNQDKLTDVTFADATVTLLGKNLLRGCGAIEKLQLPASLVNIGHGALSEMTSLKSLDLPGKTEAVGDSAFARNKAMTEVKMTESVTSVGSSAFTDCTALKSVALSGKLTRLADYLFCNCTSLPTVSIPAGVTQIDTHVFDGCTSLDNIRIPDKTTLLSSYVFNKCSSLATLDLGKGLATIDSYAITDCQALENLVIPANVTKMELAAFHDIRNLKKLRFEDGDQYIAIDHAYNMGEIGMFSNCGLENLYLGRMITYYTSSTTPSPFAKSATLRTVEFGTSVSSIQPSLFIECKALEGAVIGDGVTNISASAFEGCTALSILSLGKSLETIGERAFSGCSSLKELRLPDSMREISEQAFSSTGLTDIDFAKIETIGPEAFYRCEDLRSVTLPETLFGIGVRSFQLCTSLKYIEIPDGPRNIGSQSFSGCSGLLWITLGRTVTSIGSNAFENCNALGYIKSYNTMPPQGITGFPSEVEQTATLYVPAASIEMYRLTPAWENFFNIRPLDDATDDIIVDGMLFRPTGSGSEVTLVDADFAGLNPEELTIPAEISNDGNTYTVTAIAPHAFDACRNLTAITCLALQVPDAGADTFPAALVNSATLYVPAQALESYKADAAWGRFFHILPLESGIDDVTVSDGFNADVYTIGGVLILRNADRSSFEALAPGIYIVNNRKVYKR